MANRGGKVCLAGFPHDLATVDLPHIVKHNGCLHDIGGEGKSATHRAMAFMKEKRFDAGLRHTHTSAFYDLLEALRYARQRVDHAIKVVVKLRQETGSLREAAEKPLHQSPALQP